MMHQLKNRNFTVNAIKRQQEKIVQLGGYAFDKNNFVDRPVENLFKRTIRRPSTSAFLKFRAREKLSRGVKKVKLTLNAFESKEINKGLPNVLMQQ